MRGMIWLVRRCAAITIGASSTVAGLGGVWYVTGSGGLNTTPTATILGLVGLGVLPLCAVVLRHSRVEPVAMVDVHPLPDLLPESLPVDDCGDKRLHPPPRATDRHLSHRHREVRVGAL